MRRIDCRGLACPQPVIATKKALEEPESGGVTVLLNDPASKENVRRFAESQGHRVEISEEKGIFTLTIEKLGTGKEQAQRGREAPVPEAKTAPAGVAVFIDGDTIGRGSEELGRVLMRSFLQTLLASEPKPRHVILLNSGVKLACEGSGHLEEMQGLSAKGIDILVCGTCLDYFELKPKLLAGKISNMFEILATLNQAGKVIKI